MNPVLSEYLARSGWPSDRQYRMVTGLRALQAMARKGDRPVTYAEFAALLQRGLAPVASAAVLEDIGVFCNAAGWPNVTCFVVSATTGECSDGFGKISSEDPGVARDHAWFAYSVYKNGPLVDSE